MDETGPLPHWLAGDEDEPEPDRPRRRWVLPLIAVVPWTVVLAVVLRTAPPAPDPLTGPPSASPSPVAVGATAPSARPSASRPADGPADGAATVVTSGARVHPRLGDATALATVVARAWITDVGPTLEVEGAELGRAGDRYAEHLAVEAVDHPAPGHAVVTLLAVVLRRSGDAYDRVEVRRLAVPVVLDADGAAPAGAPWWLPGPSLEHRGAVTTPVEDEQLLMDAGAALAAAGYRDVDVRALSTTDGWPLVVHAHAVAPGADGPADHSVWLRQHLDGLVVAGDLPRTPPAEPAASGEETNP